MTEADRIVVVWWRGKRYEGSWADLYPIIRRDVEVCSACRSEYLGLERVGARLMCAECRK